MRICKYIHNSHISGVCFFSPAHFTCTPPTTSLQLTFLNKYVSSPLQLIKLLSFITTSFSVERIVTSRDSSAKNLGEIKMLLMTKSWMEMFRHTCLISLNFMFYPVLSALAVQGLCRLPELNRNQLCAGPFYFIPPSSRTTSLALSHQPLNPNLKLIYMPQLSISGLFIDYFRACT